MRKLQAVYQYHTREKPANRKITGEMQRLLAGLNSPYRRIQWSVDESTIQSQPLPEAVSNSVCMLLNDAGLDCDVVDSKDPQKKSITINTTETPLDVQAILKTHRDRVLAEMEVPENAKPFKSLVQSLSDSADELAESSDDAFNLIRDAPQVIITLAQKIDDLVIGLNSGIIKRSNTESALLSSVYYSNLFLNIFAKASPDLFRLAFRHTPVGPIFIGGYQLANDLFYAKKWRSGRREHQTALRSTGDRIKAVTSLYDQAATVSDEFIRIKKEKIQSIAGWSEAEVNQLIENSNTDELDFLTTDQQNQIRPLYNEILDLKRKLIEVQQSTKEITAELRKKSGRINVKRQLMMVTTHIDRIFNILFIGLGIGSFFIPPLAIPAIAITIGKGFTRKKITDRMTTGTEIVQGIYEIDDNVVFTEDNNKAAIQKAKGLKKMSLIHAPVAIVATKLGLTQKRTIAKTLKIIRSHPEYSLYIPDSFGYQPLDLRATPRQIRQQIDSYTITCEQLIFHLELIEGKHDFHPPYISNIDEMRQMIVDWSENLIQQIEDEQLNPKTKKDNYFGDQSIDAINTLRYKALKSIQSYKTTIDKLDRNDPTADKQDTVPQFDLKYAHKAHASIVKELKALKEILNTKTDEQMVVNAKDILERLDKRMNALFNYCDKSPDESHQDLFTLWKDELNSERESLEEQLRFTKPKKTSTPKTPSEKQHGIKITPTEHDQVLVPVQHSRYFESQSSVVQRLRERVSQNKDKQKSEKTDLVLLPVSKITSKVLFNYKNDYWKVNWLVRGIDRAIESVELTLKNEKTISAEISKENLDSLLNFYRNQLKKIEDYSPQFKFSKTLKTNLQKRIEAINKKIDDIERIANRKSYSS